MNLFMRGLRTLFIALLVASSFNVQADERPMATIKRLEANSGVKVNLTLDRVTGYPRFIRLANRADLMPGVTSSDAKAAAFFEQYSALFGIKDARSDLRMENNRIDSFGLRTQTFQQFYKGVPVLGGQLRANLDLDGKLLSVNGASLPNLDVDTNPKIGAAEAREAAIQHLRNTLVEFEAAALTVEGDTLYIVRKNMAHHVKGTVHLTFEIDVSGKGLAERVYVDAHNGKVVEQFTRIHTALDRRVYDSEYGAPFLVWSEGDALPYGDADVDQAIAYTEDTYNLFASITSGSYLGYTGNDPVAEAVVNSNLPGCPNAWWYFNHATFCVGTASDDIVAHEWAHGYTQETHALFGLAQPGALNESFSDIFGEVVDVLNAAGTDEPALVRTVDACTIYTGSPDRMGALEDSVRWLMGEDTYGFSQSPIRDLWNPNCRADPGKVSDPEYACDSADFYGVHSNAGIPNHGFALLVDGGTYNGQTVIGIGLTKAAHLYWRVMTAYQVPDSNFADHADALEAACDDLVTLPDALPGLSTDMIVGEPSSDSMTAADCQQVTTTIAAVELRTEPTQCDFQPLLQQDPPNLCGPGESVVNYSFANFEGNLSGWTPGRRNIADPVIFDAPDWAAIDSLPYDRPGGAAFVADPVSGAGNCIDLSEAGVLYLESPALAIPAGAGSLRIAFDHSVGIEPRFDGGNLKASLDGGGFSLLPPSTFTYNSYNGVLIASDNPMSGQSAFTSTDPNRIPSLWGQSQINIGNLSGFTLRLRFELGMDGCNGLIGWYVDDVRIFSCENLPDADSDAVADVTDNCTNVPNFDQRDTDDDGIGNACDPDVAAPNDCVVNFLDLGVYIDNFFQTGDYDTDNNGDGQTNFLDLSIFANYFEESPGPSANECN